MPATDADSGDTLTYSMEGIDADSFSFDTSIREISTISGVDYNYEATKNSYSVTVKVEDGNGGSDTVAVTLEVTDEDEQPDQPAKPTLAAVDGSSTTLTASWEKPDLNGGPDITGYVLQYRAGTAGNWEDFTITGTAVTATITGLTADTEYQVQVRAKNGETDSDWSDASDAVSTNADGTPDAPTITSVAVTSRPKLTSPGGSTPDTYGAGGTIEISVTFSEAVTATTDTDFVLNVGGDKRAPLLRGSGTTTLVFGYTVQSDDDDDNGIWIGDQDRTLVGNRDGAPQSADSEITSVATGAAADLTHDALNQQEGHKVNGSRQSASAPPYFEEESTRREVAHGSPPVTPVGAPVVAMDEDTPLEDLIYSLDDATNSFVMSGRGQIVVWAESFSQASYAVTVEVRDAPGGEPDDTIAVTITITGSGDPPSKEPPTVEELTAFEDSVSPGGAVVLTATARDPDGGPVTYAWSAPSGSFDQTTGRQVTWTAPENYSGDVVITVTVTDDENVTATDTVTVAVTDANRPPTVSVTPEVAVVPLGGQVTLTAEASDPDGGDLRYLWSASSSLGMFDAMDTPSVTWTAPDFPASVSILVTVYDEENAPADARATVEVTDELTVTATAEPTTVAPGGEVMLTAVALDPVGGTLTYMWSAEGAGAENFVGLRNLETAKWTAPSAPGSYGILVTVMSNSAENPAASDRVTVTVERRAAPPPPPQPPPPSTDPPTVSVTASAKMVSAGGAVELTATARDPDGGPVTYAWSAPSGSFDATDGAAATWTAPPEPGAVDIRVTVTDDEGDTASATVTVTVTVAGAPSVTSVTSAARSVPQGGEVVLSVDAHDPDGGELTYAWSASAGSFDPPEADRAVVTWTAPPEPGEVEIRVTVTDDEGETTSSALTLTVTASGAPAVTATAEPAMVVPGGAVELTASASDPDGGAVTYAWSAPSGSFDATVGAVVTWTAPPEPGEVEILVTATDDEGDSAMAAVTVTVLAPVPALPGLLALLLGGLLLMRGAGRLRRGTAQAPGGAGAAIRAAGGGFPGAVRAQRREGAGLRGAP